MALQRFAITAEPGGGTVTVDGHPVDVTTLWLRADKDGVPTLTLELAAGGTLKGEGIVTAVAAEVDPTAVADFVRCLDPQEVRERINGRRLSMADDIYEAVLDVIADMLAEATP